MVHVTACETHVSICTQVARAGDADHAHGTLLHMSSCPLQSHLFACGNLAKS